MCSKCCAAALGKTYDGGLGLGVAPGGKRRGRRKEGRDWMLGQDGQM